MIKTGNLIWTATKTIILLVKESLNTEDVGNLETTHIKLVNFILIFKKEM